MHARRFLVAAMTGLVALTAMGPLRVLTAQAVTSASLSFDPVPIFAQGSQGPNASRAITLHAQDQSNQVLPGYTIDLSLTTTTQSNGGTATALATDGTAVPLTSAPQAFQTDDNGDISITYTLGASVPHTGVDTLTAEDPATPGSAIHDVYDFDTITSLAWSTTTLNTGSEVLQANGSGLTVFLRLTTPGATGGHAAVGATQLTSTFQSFTTDSNGQVTVNYTQGTAVSGQDTLTAQDDPTNPVQSASISHQYASPNPVYTSLSVNKSPIAQAGSLGSGGSTTVTVTTSAVGGNVGNKPFTVCLTRAAGSNATASSSAGPVAICPAVTTPSTDSGGNSSITFTSSTATAACCEQLTLASSGAGDSGSATTSYDNRSISSWAFGNTVGAHPHEIASPGSENATNCSCPNTFTVIAKDGSGNLVPHAIEWLALNLTTASASTAKVGSTNLGGTPQPFETDSNGAVTVVFNSSGSNGSAGPSNGRDYVTVSTDRSNSASSVVSEAHYGNSPIEAISIVRTPIAAQGSLAPSTTKTVNVTALDINGATVTGQNLYLAFSSPSGATAKVGSTSLTGTFAAFATTSGGLIQVTYKTPSSLPASGTDLLQVTEAPVNPAASAATTYQYGSFVFSGGAGTIAAPGTLAPSATGDASLSGPVFPAGAYLSVATTASSGGGAAAATCHTNSTTTTVKTLTSTPQLCRAGTDGKISVLYTVPATLPAGGTDTITSAADAAGDGSTTRTYTYVGKIKVVTSVPIASANGIEPSGSRAVTFEAEDAAGTALGSNVPMWLSFGSTVVEPSNSTTDSAAVSAVALTGTPAKFLTNSNGQVTATLTVGGSAQANSGFDFISAADQQTGPLVNALNSYGVRTVSSYAFGQAPPAGSLSAGQPTAVTLQVVDSAGAPVSGVHRVFLSSSTPGGGNFTMQGIGITGTPQAFLTAGDGTVSGAYTAPNPLPSTQQIDILSATDTAAGGGANGNFAYVLGQRQGYWLVASDGGIFPFGNVAGYGSTGGITLNKPIVGMAPTPDAGGYWLVASDGGIFPFGDAGGYGSTGAIHLNKPIVGMASTPSGHGYWLVASDGGIFPFGDANGYGSTGGIHLNQPIVGMAATADGGGYWLVASDGGIFPFGDATGHGSTGNITLNKPIVGMAPTADGQGYWLVASDGGIFPFGDAVGHGSTGNITLNKPIVGMAPTHDGGGYWLVASDGGIFPFGDAQGLGSTGGTPLNKPIVGMAAVG